MQFPDAKIQLTVKNRCFYSQDFSKVFFNLEFSELNFSSTTFTKNYSKIVHEMRVKFWFINTVRKGKCIKSPLDLSSCVDIVATPSFLEFREENYQKISKT